MPRVLGSVLHGITSDLCRALALRLLQVASKRPRREDVPATAPKTHRVERGDMEGVLAPPVLPDEQESVVLADMYATIAAAGGGFTPQKCLSARTSTKQTHMYVCDDCANTFLRSTNHANLRSHKGGQGCTSHLEAHKATRPLDKFLRKDAVVSVNNDRPPNPAILCQGFFRQRVAWRDEVLDTTLLHDAPTTAQWIPYPHNQFSEVRRNADVPFEHKGTIKSRDCALFATKPNSSAPTFTYVWLTSICKPQRESEHLPRATLTRCSSVDVHPIHYCDSLHPFSTSRAHLSTMVFLLLPTT